MGDWLTLYGFLVDLSKTRCSLKIEGTVVSGHASVQSSRKHSPLYREKSSFLHSFQRQFNLWCQLLKYLFMIEKSNDIYPVGSSQLSKLRNDVFSWHCLILGSAVLFWGSIDNIVTFQPWLSVGPNLAGLLRLYHGCSQELWWNIITRLLIVF